MKHFIFVPVILLALAISGCKAPHSVIATTQTGLGVSVSENPSTQLYEVRFGFFRNEFTYVPGSTNQPGTVPDVLMELRYENILKGGSLYQRLAVGKNAVTQPGASFLFAKGADGTLTSEAASAVSATIQQGVAAAPATGVVEALVPIAEAYASGDKAKFEEVAISKGYESFSSFLIDKGLTVDKVSAMVALLKQKGLMQ